MALLKHAPTLNKKGGTFKHVNDAYIQFITAFKFQSQQQNIFIVLPNLYAAQKYYDTLSEILGDEAVLFYPADQMLTTMMALGSPEFKNERLHTIRTLLENKRKYLIVTTPEGILQRQLKPQDYLRSVFDIKTGGTYDVSKIVKTLVYNGYQQNYTVERPGEFSLRGSILDIFSYDSKDPYRLDFFGDELETIKLFDVITQKSFQVIDEISLTPLSELFFTDQQKHEAINKINSYMQDKELSEKEQQKINQDLENLSQRRRLDSLMLYISFFNEQETTILNFSSKHHIVVVDPFKMKLNEETLQSDLATYSHTMQGSILSQLPVRIALEHLINQAKDIYDLYRISDVGHNLGIIDPIPFSGVLESLYVFLQQYQDYTIVFSLIQEKYMEEIRSFFDNYHVSYHISDALTEGQIHLTQTKYPGSFIDEKHKIIVLTEDILFLSKQRHRIRYRSVINQSTKIRDTSELNAGDYVVHYDFGIGQYLGLKTMQLSGQKRDYLHIIYDKGEALYVPTDQIDLVLKYRSNDDLAPKLSRLGTKQWSKTKASVKKRIKDLSDRLLKLYAARNQTKGFAFSKDSEAMLQFENDFGYEETKDQQTAIQKVKADMEVIKPMDRLIAGDVGFGKTEVALRAAFKAVLDVKQVAYLVPTTVLARQHYYTFKERFEKYGANVALLSRFVSKKEQKEIINKLSKGYVDVVIGTHRLLSEDIKFKDLGLFIIDEEQRFGVEHKEKIKEIKVNVDTLTLSATPIPRTLQMAMYGLKDLSMIETPPLNRYPVQTYVVERHDALIKEAIDRELARAGQVFYLYNRVEDIDRIVLKLNKLAPQARIAFAHGKMSKDKLEDVLSDFIDKSFDILVATTIIETGVDIPNTNTLIIHDADTFGLAQLYQLRGRVGRSDRIAYAYLMFDARKNINDEARKRLAVIEDFTELGSGFKIALRDLSIRGAGDILGQEQSGFIDSVGMELYMKLLDEVMSGKIEDEPRKEIVDEVFASRHIPTEYIDNDSVRIEIHKRIAGLSNMEQLDDLKVELEDRFGGLDVDVVTYMYEKLFKKLAYKLGVEKTRKDLNEVVLTLSESGSQNIDGEKLLYAASRAEAQIRLSNVRGKVQIMIMTKNQKEHWLYLSIQFISGYFE